MECSTKRKKYDETRTTPLNIVYNSCKKEEKKCFCVSLSVVILFILAFISFTNTSLVLYA